MDLLVQADQEFVKRYPELDGQRRGPLLPGIRFLLARLGAATVGCCALQKGGDPFTKDTYEVKRLFVIPGARGSGAADALMISIESLASEIGAKLLCFETGTRQPEAIHVVLRHGYTPVKPYSPYYDDPFARCFDDFLEVRIGHASFGKIRANAEDADRRLHVLCS